MIETNKLDYKYLYFMNYWKHNGDASPEKEIKLIFIFKGREGQ